MSIRLYLPFRKHDFKNDVGLANSRADLKKTGLGFHTSRLRLTGQALKDVKKDDLVLIDGHGFIGSSSISCDGAHGTVSLTATDLAQQLSDQGLPKTHGSILMASCHGGGTSKLVGNKGGGTLSPEEGRRLDTHSRGFRTEGAALALGNNKAGECFASILAKALGKLNYGQILVGGWPGEFTPISHTIGAKSAFYTDANERVLAQLDHIQWYDARGVHQTPELFKSMR